MSDDRCPICGERFSPKGMAIHQGIKHRPRRPDRERALREAIQYEAIPTLLIFADDNGGVRAVIERLRAAVREERP